MKKNLLLATVAAATLGSLAWAQPPAAKDTITVNKEAPKAAPPKESLPTPGSAPKPKLSRDPFVEGGGGGEAAPAPLKPEAQAKAQAAPGGAVEIKDPKDKGPQIAAPEVELKGVVISPRGNKAIIQGPKMTFIVKAGDKLGDYKVASIDKRQVVFAFKDKKFPIKMKDEFDAK
jgi:hypothetical protein